MTAVVPPVVTRGFSSWLRSMFKPRLLIFIPIDLHFIDIIEDPVGTSFAEIFPGPFQKCSNFCQRRGQQRCVHPEPRRKSSGTFKFVAMLPDFRNGGVAADHSHDP